MRSQDGWLFFSNVNTDTTSAAFTLEGGVYVMDVVASATGSITLQRKGPDGGTQIAAFTAMTATGTSGAVALPPGDYTMVNSGLRAVFASLSRVPGD